MSRRRSITIDLEDYIDLPDERALERARENLGDGLRCLRGPTPNVQEALIYLERADQQLKEADA